MKIRPSLFIQQDTKVLLLKYSYSGQYVYNLPGGNLDDPETITDTAERELLEEVGITVKSGKLLGIAETERNESTVLHLIFDATLLNGTPTLNPVHTSALAVEWVDINQLEEIHLYPSVAKFLVNPTDNTYWGRLNQIWI